MRKPKIYKDNLFSDDEQPWCCCYEDEESNIEWSEGKFAFGIGCSPREAYEDWRGRLINLEQEV